MLWVTRVLDLDGRRRGTLGQRWQLAPLDGTSPGVGHQRLDAAADRCLDGLGHGSRLLIGGARSLADRDSLGGS